MGFLILDFIFWTLDFGFWIFDFGSDFLVSGFWILDVFILDMIFWILDFGFWISDFGFESLDSGLLILDSCFSWTLRCVGRAPAAPPHHANEAVGTARLKNTSVAHWLKKMMMKT